jgi:hypothetical protein
MARDPHTRSGTHTKLAESYKEEKPLPIPLPVTTDNIAALPRIVLATTRKENIFSSALFQTTRTTHYDNLVDFINTKLALLPWPFIKALHVETQQVLAWGASNTSESDWAWISNHFDTSVLSGFLNDKYTSIQREWFAGRRFLYLAALFTEPETQGRGVGMDLSKS